MNKKGFISIYALVLLQLSIAFSMMLITRVKTSYLTHQDHKLTFVEIHTIHKVKQDLIDYVEKDEEYTFLDFNVSLVYDDITCFITIKYMKQTRLVSKLKFDDLEEEIVEYSYLDY